MTAASSRSSSELVSGDCGAGLAEAVDGQPPLCWWLDTPEPNRYGAYMTVVGLGPITPGFLKGT